MQISCFVNTWCTESCTSLLLYNKLNGITPKLQQAVNVPIIERMPKGAGGVICHITT